MEISTWRVVSALAVELRTFFFEIGEKCEKTLQTPHQTGGDDNDLLRLDVVDFRAFEALGASQVDLIAKVSSVSNERIVLQLMLVVQSDDTR